jgi:hypothetical protein
MERMSETDGETKQNVGWRENKRMCMTEKREEHTEKENCCRKT